MINEQVKYVKSLIGQRNSIINIKEQHNWRVFTLKTGVRLWLSIQA